MRQFLVNFWGQTHTCSVGDERALEAQAQQLAAERGTIVSYHEVIDGKVVFLGAVKSVSLQYKVALANGGPQAKPLKDPPKPVASTFAPVPTRKPVRVVLQMGLAD